MITFTEKQFREAKEKGEALYKSLDWAGFFTTVFQKKTREIYADKKITRGEMAEMIYRLHAGVEDLPSGELL